jgi:hypothetical protein
MPTLLRSVRPPRVKVLVIPKRYRHGHMCIAEGLDFGVFVLIGWIIYSDSASTIIPLVKSPLWSFISCVSYRSRVPAQASVRNRRKLES